jgi:hypothetical protein
MSKDGVIFSCKGQSFKGTARLLATDSYSEIHELDILVDGNKATFQNNNIEMTEKIVSFVYGDSQRWQYLNEYRERHNHGIAYSFYFIIKNAVINMFAMIKHIFICCFRKSKRQAIKGNIPERDVLG